MNETTAESVVRPWYREPWPWIIIGLLGTVVLASLATFWIAASNPDGLVVDDETYQEIRRGLRAQDNPDEAAASGGDGVDQEAESSGGGA